MERFSKIWYWVVVTVVLILAAGITTLFPQTNDVPVSEETKPLDTPNEVDSVSKVELQQEVPASSSPDVDIDPSDKVELQQFFNELRKEYLDTRAESVNWWLQFVTIVLAFFGIIVVVLGYFGIKSFKELESDAKQYLEEIKEHHAQSEAELRKRTSQDFNDPDKAREVEEDIRDVRSAPDPSPVDRTIADIYDLQLRGEIEDAIEKWRSIGNIVEGTDTDFAARSWFSVGYLYGETDRKEDSLSAYNKAIHLKPDFAEAYVNRGIVKSELGQHEAAIDDCNEAIRLKPDEAEAYYNRGIVKSELGQHEAAIDDYNEAIRLKSDYAEAYNNRGFTKSELGQHEAAIDDYNEAIRLKSDYAEAYNNRGFTKSELGQHEAAINDCNEAIRLKPDLAEAYDSRGTAKQSLGQHEAAIDDYNEAIRLKPDYAEFYYNRGNVHVDMKNIEDAKADFQTALELAEQPEEADLKTNIEQRLRELNGTE